MNKKKNRRTGYALVIVLLLLLFVGFGYAVLSDKLTISGITKIGKPTWDVHFTSLSKTANSVAATQDAVIGANQTSVSFEVSLAVPGDFYEFTVDAENKGTVPAKVSTKSLTGVTAEQDVYVNYTVTYADGSEIRENDALAVGATAKYKVRVEYDKNITKDQLPDTAQSLNLGFSVDYIQQ